MQNSRATLHSRPQRKLDFTLIVLDLTSCYCWLLHHFSGLFKNQLIVIVTIIITVVIIIGFAVKADFRRL